MASEEKKLSLLDPVHQLNILARNQLWGSNFYYGIGSGNWPVRKVKNTGKLQKNT